MQVMLVSPLEVLVFVVDLNKFLNFCILSCFI